MALASRPSFSISAFLARCSVLKWTKPWRAHERSSCFGLSRYREHVLACVGQATPEPRRHCREASTRSSGIEVIVGSVGAPSSARRAPFGTLRRGARRPGRPHRRRSPRASGPPAPWDAKLRASPGGCRHQGDHLVATGVDHHVRPGVDRGVPGLEGCRPAGPEVERFERLITARRSPAKVSRRRRSDHPLYSGIGAGLARLTATRPAPWPAWSPRG